MLLTSLDFEMSKGARNELKAKVADIEAAQQELGSKIAGMSADEASKAIKAAQAILDSLKIEKEQAARQVQEAATAARSMNMHMCDNSSCKNKGILSCSACKLVKYCSQDCQKFSWKMHKVACKQNRAFIATQAKGPITSNSTDAIKSLMEEAASARKELERARKDAENMAAKSRKALEELNAAEKQKDYLAEKLKTNTDVMGEELAKQMNSDSQHQDQEDSDSDSTEEVQVEDVKETANGDINLERDHNIKKPKSIPNVQLEIIEDQSVLLAGNKLSIQYTISDGEWDEDDSIVLSCSPSISRDKRILYLEDEESKGRDMEEIEYTNKPNSSGVAVVQFNLPSFGSTFSLSYIRTISSLFGSIGSETVKRQSQELAKLIFTIPCRVQDGSPDKRSRGFPRRRGSEIIPRPLVGQSSNRNLSVIVEELCNIKVISVIITHAECSTGKCELSKIQAWIVPEPTVSGTQRLIVEADETLYIDSKGVKPISTTFIYCSILLKSPGVLDLTNSQIEINDSGRVVVRLPLITNTYQVNNEGSLDTDKEQNNIRDIDGVKCQFCENELVSGPSISEINALPSGAFDNMMHDFICSEDISALNICTTDMTTPSGSLLAGSAHVTINPLDICEGSVIVAPKGVPTILDLFSGHGAALACAPMPSNSNGVHPPSVISIDTCILQCGRCLSYIGDGQIGDTDCECPPDLHPPSRTKTNNQRLDNDDDDDEKLELVDVRDIRFSRMYVEIANNLLPKAASNWEHYTKIMHPFVSRAIPGNNSHHSLALEQVISRTLIHLMDVLGVSSFFINTPTPPGSCGSKVDFIIVRIISKDYKAGFPRTFVNESDESTCPALKMSFVRKADDDTGTLQPGGTETRVPLSEEDLELLGTLLTQRSQLLGPSIFKGQHLSFLFL